MNTEGGPQAAFGHSEADDPEAPRLKSVNRVF
jgi:hypothetical protein